MISDTWDDKTLIKEYIAGDQESGNELALRYYPRVLSVCFQYLRTAEAHDAAQDVFLKILGRRKISTYSGESRLWTWLYRVTVNTCYKHLSLRLARAVKTLPLAEQSWLEACLPAPGPNPEEMSAVREQMERMVKMIYHLRDSYRDPLVLVYLRGYTCAQAAGELGITTRALAVRINRAKKKLANMMRQTHAKQSGSREMRDQLNLPQLGLASCFG